MVLWVFGYGSLIWNPGFDFDQKILGFIKGYKRTFNLACIDHRGTPKDPARTCTLESEEEAICTTKETGLYLDGCHFLDDNALPTLVQFPCKVGEIIGTMTGFFGFGSQLLSYYQTGSFSILEKLRCYATCTVWGIAYCVNGGLEKEQEAMRYLEKRECEYDQKISVDFYEDANSLEPSVTGVLVFVSTPDPVGNKYYLGPAPLEDMARQIATANGPNGNNRDYLFSMEKALSNISHEDDSIIELADEVRKVLSRSNEKKITGSDIPLKSHAPLVYLSPLLEGTVVDLR